MKNGRFNIKHIFFEGMEDAKSSNKVPKVPLEHRVNTKVNTIVITAPHITGTRLEGFTFAVDKINVGVFRPN